MPTSIQNDLEELRMHQKAMGIILTRLENHFDPHAKKEEQEARKKPAKPRRETIKEMVRRKLDS